MNNFLVFVRKGDRVTLPKADLLEPYLVRKPSSTEKWTSQNGHFCILSFQVCAQAAHTGLHSAGQAALTFDGFPFLSSTSVTPDSGHGRALLDGLRDDPQELNRRLSGEYSLAFVKGEKLLVTSSLGGSHAVYYTVNKDFVAFSNRAPLLLALPFTTDDLSADASSWLCYQGYVGGTLTPFETVKKLPLGATAEIDENGNLNIENVEYRDILDLRMQESFSKDPTAALEDTCLKIVDYLQRFTAYYDSQPLRVRLSGGKDSRLVLALLIRAGLKSSISSVMTRGPSYSPEVLAAHDVCAAIGFENHEIRRPSGISSSEVSFRLITNSVNYTEGNLSLYDFMGIDPRRETSVCGHQLTLRPGAYKDCRVTSFQEFVEDATVARYHDPLSLLRDRYRERIRSDFARRFDSYKEEGAPLIEFGDLHLLRDRLLNWAAVINNADYFSGPLTNPLLLPEVLRFSFSLPPDVRSLEIPHFMWMRSCDPRLPGIPFADDAWDPGLCHKLSELGIPAHQEGRPVIAYQSHSSFPNLSNPLVPSVKLEYFHVLRPLMREILKEEKGRISEYLDVNRLDGILAEDRDPALRELYCIMGIYTDLLFHAYGKALFDRNASADIAEELRDRSKSILTRKTGLGTVDPQGEIDHYEDALLRHELCAAALVREIQQVRNDAANQMRALPKIPSQEGFDSFFVVKLPKAKIRQVRIDPMNEPQGEFELSGVALMIGPDIRQIPFLGPDDYLNIINAEILSVTDSGISFRATGENRPWLALKDLNNLDLSRDDSAELFVRLKTSRGRQLTVYWDVGDGYSSDHCERIAW